MTNSIDVPVPAPRLSRRRLLGASAVAGAGLLGLSGCSSGGTKPRLDYWHLMSGGDGILMGDMVAAVNERSEFDAQQTVLAWGAPYYTKLAMASVGGRAPELAIMHHTRVAGYAPGGLLEPWDTTELERLGIGPSTQPERIWEKGTYEGEVYSVAIDAHPFIMMVNTDIADQAGVATPDGLVEFSSPEEMLEVGRRLAEVTGRTGLSYGFLADGAQMWRFFYTLYRQQGAEMTLNSGEPMQYEMDAAVVALDTLKSMLDGTVTSANASIDSAIAEFASGTSGVLFTGVWKTPTMLDAGIPLAATTIPTMFTEPAAYADSHAFVLPRQSVVDPERRAAAYEFVASMLKDSATWAQAGHIPAYLPVVESEEYQSLPQSSYADATEIINYDPPAYFTGSGSDFQTYFAENVQNALLGRIPAEQGMLGFAERIDALLAAPNPVA
ncbi:extracellular solute-binding protein [Auraticoccus monumenti]|uniref:Carbohydrate ABC transporter substrate-binding protein, CUT1 family n=1 Tax=Auraticoccus monumenti TaxID=675864 RepID=A0A1G6ZPN5_9ACTN|nr:extracellular solute-binding protein [Auraticoccus monumenti]SDE04353.1 carbohydrate ABC transporter substrate-binding protein, CUT1 family [Auraticoccus monumenti]